MRNWRDPALTKGGDWAPLELVVAPIYRANFMFMETVTVDVAGQQVEIFLYKHDMTREYVNVDAAGNLYAYQAGGYVQTTLENAQSQLVPGLISAIDDGCDISRDMTSAYERLARLTGLDIRKTK